MRYVATCLVFFLVLGSTFAQERVFTEYEYDEVGNTTRVTQDATGLPPSIDDASPSTVRRNQVIDIALSGSGLRGASLSNSDDVFTFSNIRSTNDQLIFTVSVDQNAEQGPTQVSLSTGLGTAFFSLNVLAELPELRVSPTPITLLHGSSREILVSLSQEDLIDHEVSISIQNESIATANVSQISITQGQIKPNQAVVLNALTNGSTRINFQSDVLGSFHYTIRVTDDEFIAQQGEVNNFISPNLGLNKSNISFLFSLRAEELSVKARLL